jgi:hypothetical protein
MLGNFTLPLDGTEEMIAQKYPHQFPSQLNYIGSVISHTDKFNFYCIYIIYMLFKYSCLLSFWSDAKNTPQYYPHDIQALHMTFMVFVWVLNKFLVSFCILCSHFVDFVLIVIQAREYLLDTFLLLYVRSGFHVDRGEM